MWPSVGAAPTPGGRKALLAAILGTVVFAAAAAPGQAATYRYVSPKGSDLAACSRAEPCRTFNRVYRVVRPGQTVILRRGTYRTQVIRLDRRKTSARDVVFRPASGARVVVRGYVKVLARHVELRGFRVGTWIAYAPAKDVTIRSVTADRFLIAGASDVSVLGGTLGPMDDASNVIAAASGASRDGPQRILLDGITVRGYRRTSGATPVHCLAVRAATGLTVRRSRFLDCEDSALFFTQGSLAGPPANVTLENNVLARSGADALRLDGAHGERWRNFLVRNNSMTGALTISPESDPASDLRFYSNVAAGFSGCGQAGVTADYNVWTSGSACGPSDAVAPSGFTDPEKNDFDLVPGSAAIDRAPEAYSSTDITGQARPIGWAGDAGAYETVASGLVAAYPFNEGLGAIAFDVSGKGNSGAVAGATWSTAGRFGGALSFDGTNDWVTVVDAPSLDLATQLTIEAWVKPTVLGTAWRTVAIKEQPGNLVYALYANTDTRGASGHVYVGGDMNAQAPDRLPVGTWTHVATTYDGATLRLYMNGAEVNRRPLTGTLTVSSGALRVGGNAVWNEWFSGTIDELRLYGRALPPGQIKKDMSKPLRAAVDGEPPSEPAGLTVTGQGGSSVSLSWSASSDNVGVAGYGLYRNGSSVGSSAGTSYTFSGLSCATSYTLAVDASDAAGNRSGKTTLAAATSACPPAGTADVYVAASGSDTNACTQAAPCRTFDRAYRVAGSGDVVEVAGGTYPGQTISSDFTKTSTADVLFRPASSADVSVSGEMSVYADHVEFRDMTFGGWKTFLGTDDVTFRNIETVHLFIWSSSNISVIGGAVGVLNQKRDYDSNITTASGSSTAPTNILIDGVWFHDWIDVDPGQANHIECLQIGSGVNLTIRNSRFERCGTHDIFIRSWGTINGSYHPLRNVVVENNFLGKTDAGFYSIQFVDDLATDSTSFVVRNNSTLQAFHDGIERGTISFVGNVLDSMTSWECGQSTPSRWSYNVYESGVKCGSTDFVGAVSYRDRARLDLHLLAGSAAIGRGSPTNYAAGDIDGEARPLGGAPDAGADEVP
jgi:chitodextrinase